MGSVSAGGFVKHRGTEITEKTKADFSVPSVTLCFSFHHFIQHPPELHDLIVSSMKLQAVFTTLEFVVFSNRALEPRK